MAPRRKKVALERKAGDDAPAGAQVATLQMREVPARRNVRGRRGGLKDMPSMPLDILLEILRLLEPRDLLNLARTSKPFRELLMSRESASMWRAARANVEGLPDCPSHLSEPAYANLAFFSHCHGCLKPNVQTIHWEFAKRYCRLCLNANTISAKDTRRDHKYAWMMVFYHEEIYTRVILNSRNVAFHRPELDEIHRDRERLLGDPQGWDAYIKERKERVRNINRHAGLCYTWMQKRSLNRSAELQNTREQRLHAIVEKLRELGWADELDRIAPLDYYPLRENAHVKVSKPLTNRGWPKIKDDLVALMEDIKKRRLRAERRATLLTRLGKLKAAVTAARTAPPKRTAADEAKPRCRDLAMMPEVRRVIEAPNEVAVTEQTLRAVVEMLPALEERWLRARRAELVEMLREGGDGIEVQDGVDPLDLAAVVFRCRECNRYLHHPHVLMHECKVGSSVLYDKAEYQYTDYYKCVFEACGRKHAWEASAFCVAPRLERVRALIEACGKDPKATTSADMDASRIKLVYDDRFSGALVMSWRKAVEYTSARNPQDVDIAHWRVATDEDKEAVRVREIGQRERMRLSNVEYANLRCAYCGLGRTELAASTSALAHVDMFARVPLQLKRHLQSEHEVQNPTLENGDFYVHPDDQPELEPIPIKEPPRLNHRFGWMSMGFDSDGFDDYDSYEDDLYGDPFGFDYGDPYDYDDFDFW